MKRQIAYLSTAIFGLIVGVISTSLGAVEKSEVTEKAAPSPIHQGSEWLEGQPEENFTIQLLATRNISGIVRYAQQKGLAGQLVHFEVDQGGKKMHLLAEGSYATEAAAKEAAKGLPAELQPWIRRLAGIKQAMTKSTSTIKTTAASPVMEGGVKGMPWLWSQDPQAYTIQLAGAESRQAVETVMHSLTLPGERMVIRTRQNDRAWYTLIYGRFGDEDSARATIGRLPKALQQTKPWPRRFASLHDEIGMTNSEMPENATKPDK